MGVMATVGFVVFSSGTIFFGIGGGILGIGVGNMIGRKIKKEIKFEKLPSDVEKMYKTKYTIMWFNQNQSKNTPEESAKFIEKVSSFPSDFN
jgi:hypothetical protein